MKEKLQGALGAFGSIIYWVIMILISVLPLIMIGTPFFVDLIILVLCYFFQFLSIPLWIWGLIEAIRGPQDIFAIIYYIATVIIFLPTIISIISSFISNKKETKVKKNKKNIDDDNEKNIVIGWKTDTLNEEKNISGLKSLPNLASVLLTSSICSCLSENKYILSDTLLFYNHIIKYYVSNSRIPDEKKEEVLDYIINKTVQLMSTNTKISISQINELQQKRNVYVNRFFEEKINNRFDLQNIIDELLLICIYDITYEDYVEFNENSPVMIIGMDEELKYNKAVNAFFGAISSEIPHIILID